MPEGFRKIGVITLIFLLFFTIFSPLQSYFALPTHQKISVGDKLTLGLNFPDQLMKQLSIDINDTKGILNLKNTKITLSENKPIANQPGHFKVQLKLFGLIPLKKINIDVVENIKLYPGGQAIGVLLRTDGILVVGQSPILDEKGNAYFPAKEAGIKIGDVIVKVDQKKINTDEQLAKIINKLGKENKEVNLLIKRNNILMNKKIKPIYCLDTKSYRIGLFVRDNAGGVGTLTFYDPITKKYGALGHMISDSQTNQEINIKYGKLVKASIKGIQIGKRGRPGEKIGMFIEKSYIGNIEQNSYCGIFGTINDKSFLNKNNKPIDVGFKNQVEIGSAQILTVVKDENVEKFDIFIERIMPARSDGKGMIIRITDPDLLKMTGGIIQGMSGSPIIQNNKIVGAVTHVFINDPTRGYGIFIEDMLEEAGILHKKQIDKLGA